MVDIKPYPARKYDVVLFGATGFTGNLIARHLIKTDLPGSFRWAITGRSAPKLEKTFGELESLIATGKGRKENLPTILDFGTYTPESIIGDARVVCSVVGPSTYHAEQFLKLAVEHGTSWVDLSGEPQWHRDMIGKYGKRAKETGAVVIPSCGMDCVPSDVGALVLAAQVGGELRKVEAVYETVEFTPSTGTLQSMVAPYEKYSYEVDVKGPTGYLKNAYYLCPDIEHSALPKQRVGREVVAAPPNRFYVGEKKNVKPVSKGVIGSNGFVECLNRTVVMRSLALQSQHPKKAARASFSQTSFDFREFMLFPARFGTAVARLIAFIHSFQFTHVLPFLLSYSFFRKIIMFLVKIRGENTGISPERQESDYLRLRMVGSSATDPKQGFMVLETFKDPGYGWTAEVIGSIAVFLALKVRGEKPEIGEKGRALLPGVSDEEADLIFDGEDRKGGFWTTACLGVGLARWLQDRTSSRWQTGWVEQ